MLSKDYIKIKMHKMQRNNYIKENEYNTKLFADKIKKQKIIP